MSEKDFAAILCSRLCHDLVSPIGAITNGVEILREDHDEGMREQVTDLLEQSASQATHKLQFFRLAFGAAGGFSEQLDIREAEKAIRGLVTGSKITLDWTFDFATVSKSELRALLNTALIAFETLVRGGDLRIAGIGDPNRHIYRISASGPRIILRDSVEQVLLNPDLEPELDPKTVPAILTNQSLRELGGNLQLEHIDDGELLFSINLPNPA